MANTERLTIAKLERQSSGGFGFNITFSNGRQAVTKPGAQVAYKIENSEFQESSVNVEFDEKGQIIDVQV